MVLTVKLPCTHRKTGNEVRERENKKVADAGSKCLIYAVAEVGLNAASFLNLKCLSHMIYITLSVRMFCCFDSYFKKNTHLSGNLLRAFSLCVCALLSDNNKSPVPTHTNTHCRPYDCAMVTKEQFVWPKTVAHGNNREFSHSLCSIL